MNGVSQLRELYADEARDVSEPADVMARAIDAVATRPAPVQRRRGWLAPVAAATAAATVAALAVGLSSGAWLGPRASRPGALPPLARTQFRQVVSLDAVPGYLPSGWVLARDSQTVELRSAAQPRTVVGAVTVYAEGAYHGSASSDTATSVRGRAAQYKESPIPAHALDALTSATLMTRLSWQFATDSWAIVTLYRPLTQQTQVQALHIAEALRITEARDLRLPYRIGYLPPGLQRCDARTLPGDGHTSYWDTAISLGPAGTPICRYTLGIEAVSKEPRAVLEPEMSLRVNGHPASYGVGLTFGAALGALPPNYLALADSNTALSGDATPTLTVDLGALFVVISGKYPKATLVKIAESMTTADLSDRSTWFDAGG